MSQTSWRTKTGVDLVVERALMLKNIRAFFDAREVMEVETPLLSHSATTDPHLDSFSVCFRGRNCYLNTSPEYAMKRLLADFRRPIFQVCKAFRDDELGANHNPEFSLLEWYRPGFDMQQLMHEMAELITSLCVNSQHRVILNPTFEYISYQQAFEYKLGINPHATTAQQCSRLAFERGITIPQGLTPDEEQLNDWLDWLLTEVVLPSFGKQSFTFLFDYPASQCALAKIEINERQYQVAKRFELFFGETELANGFYELTDADVQLERFKNENAEREANGKKTVPIDMQLIAALRHGLPECSGVALGLDRLLMIIAEVSSIDEVISFAWNDC